MISREVVEKRVGGHFGELRERFGIEKIYVFGSVARGDAGPGSDVDLLIECRKGTTLFQIVDARDYLRDLLEVERVDLVMRDALVEELRDDILEEAIPLV